jgi:hypothetical protein
VDVVTDFYLEFSTGKNGDLEIRPGGINFFDDAREALLAEVCEPDAERVREATSKVSLMHWVGQEEVAAVPFHKLRNGLPKPYLLQTIKTRESDLHHIVIGIRQNQD